MFMLMKFTEFQCSFSSIILTTLINSKKNIYSTTKLYIHIVFTIFSAVVYKTTSLYKNILYCSFSPIAVLLQLLQLLAIVHIFFEVLGLPVYVYFRYRHFFPKDSIRLSSIDAADPGIIQTEVKLAYNIV